MAVCHYAKCGYESLPQAQREPVFMALDEETMHGEDTDLFTEDMLETLAEALSQLPKRERDIIIYRFITVFR